MIKHFIIFLFSAIPLCLIAQQNARITVREKNGAVSKTMIKEFMVSDENDVEDALRELGVMNSDGSVRDGVDIQVEMVNALSDSSLSSSFPSVSPGYSVMPPSACQAFLGVVLKNNKNAEASTGALVTDVEPNSPASSSGILAGDIIYQIDDKKISSAQEAIIYIRGKCKGDQIMLRVMRGQKKKKFKVELSEKLIPQANAWDVPGTLGREGMNEMFGAGNERAFLGVTPSSAEVPSGAGVVVIPGSAADVMGIQTDDIIVELNGEVILSFNHLSEKVSEMKPNEEVELVVSREGKMKRLSGKLGSKMTGGTGDFRYFFDDKGLDEGGLSVMDFEFDMDMNDLQRQLEEMMREFNPGVDMQRSFGKIRIEEFFSSEEAAIRTCERAPDLNHFSLGVDARTGDVLLKILPASDRAVRIELLDGKGEIVFMEERKISSEYSRSMEIRDQIPGRYFIRVSQDDSCMIKTVVKANE
jgi:hypothetical protein